MGDLVYELYWTADLQEFCSCGRVGASLSSRRLAALFLLLNPAEAFNVGVSGSLPVRFPTAVRIRTISHPSAWGAAPHTSKRRRKMVKNGKAVKYFSIRHPSGTGKYVRPDGLDTVLEVRFHFTARDLARLHKQADRDSLNLSSEEDALKSLNAVQDWLDFRDDEVKQMVLKWPQIMSIGSVPWATAFGKLMEFVHFGNQETKDILIRRPQFLALQMTGEDIASYAELQEALRLSSNDLKKIIRWELEEKFRDGTGMMDVRVNALPILKKLGEVLKMSKTDLKKVVLRRPSILNENITAVASMLETVQERLQLTTTELKKVVKRRPLVLETKTQVLASIEGFQKALELSDQELKKMFLRSPSMLGQDTGDKLNESMKLLQEWLFMNKAELKKFALLKPEVLGLRMVENVLPSLEVIQVRLTLTNLEVKKLVKSHPSILTYNAKNNVLPTIGALQEALGLNQEELKKVVLGYPQVIGLNIEENVSPTLAALQERLGLRKTELKKIVTIYPRILGCNYEVNIGPKIDWLQKELGLTTTKLRKTILANPTRLGYSIESRYRPRLEACRTVGEDGLTILKRATLTDARFCKILGLPSDALSFIREELENHMPREHV